MIKVNSSPASLHPAEWFDLSEECQEKAVEWFRRQGLKNTNCAQARHVPGARYAQLKMHLNNENGGKYVNECGCLAFTIVNVDVVDDPPPWANGPLPEVRWDGWEEVPKGNPRNQDRPDTTR